MSGWTKEPPKEDGFYWWRANETTIWQFIVFWNPNRKTVAYFDPMSPSCVQYRAWGNFGEWWPDPIQPPKEEK